MQERLMQNLALALACALTLAACGTPTWQPGPGLNGAGLSAAKSGCWAFAKSGDAGFYAQGTAGFVAGAALGNPFGNALRTEADFDACMSAGGWQAAGAPHPQLPPVTLVTADGHARLFLPAGWVRREPARTIPQKERKLLAAAPSAQSYVGLVTEGKAALPSLEAAADLSLRNQLAKLVDAHATAISRITVNARPALHYEISGFLPNGAEIGYSATLLETQTQIVGVYFWTAAARLAEHRRLFASLLEGVSEPAPSGAGGG